MKTLTPILGATMLALTMAALPAHAMTDTQCADAFAKADTHKMGYLTEADGMRYYAVHRAMDKPVDDGKLTREQFLMNCKADAYVMIDNKVDAGAPLPGSNSFTENQAKDRAIARGMTDVGKLTKDDKGVWRGAGMSDGKSASVAVDYKGNVVITQS